MIRRLIVCCLSLLGLAHARAQAPGTDFSATPTSGCAPLTVQFKDLSTNNPTGWNWDFGNGAALNTQNPAVNYNSPGTYTVTLIARNATGANAMRKVGYITVFPAPLPAFTSNITLACAPANVQFTDQSTPGAGSITAWLWNFGDGNTSTAASPLHVYNQTGYYNVNLKVTNSGGCSNSATSINYLRVVDGVQANFDYDQASTSCAAPFIVNFLNQTAGPGKLTYNWSLGTGAVPANSTDTNPSGITYGSAGTYTVNLQVNSSLGCSNSIQKTVTLANSSTILNGPATACVNTPATFSDGTTPTPPSIAWDFGDGTGATTSTVTKTYTNTGPYTVKLVNKYPSCIDSTTRLVQVVLPPTANFTISSPSPAAACKPTLTVNFTDQSTPAPIKWSWDFGDGKTDTVQNPSYTYTTSGTFDVKLTITGAGGCTNTFVQSAAVKVTGPSVIIEQKDQLGACVKGTGAQSVINPIADVTSVVPVTGYNWSAPGSNEGSSTATTPSFTYNTPGIYNLNVTVTAFGGCTSATATSTVEIGTATTVAGTMNFPSTVCGNNLVTFTSTAVPATSYQWDFGDGTKSGQSKNDTITHRYTQLGTFNVNLSVVSNGCPNSFTMPITINPSIPNFGFSFDCTTQAFSFTDSTLLGGTTPTSYTWDFGDGAANDQTVTTAPYLPTAHTYAGSGAYNVSLIVVDGTCKDTTTRTIVKASVTADFSLSQPTVCRGQNIQLISTSTSTPVSAIGSYDWQIDPSATILDSSSTNNGAIKNFAIFNPGTFPVTLTVKDVNGCSYPPVTHNITITGPVITSFTTAPTTNGCKNAPITFVQNITPYPGNPIAKWQLDYGNSINATFSTPPPPYTWPDTGNYTVTLTVLDNNQCPDHTTTTIQITKPTASFSGPDSFYCPGVPLTFIDSSKGYGPLLESWNFGDLSPNQSTPTHTFSPNATLYNVTLVVTDKYNCADTIEKPVRIEQPIAAFDISDTTAICAPLQTKFVAHGQFYDSLYWNFGDSSTSTLPTTSHFYNNYGIDTAKLFVQGPGGCLDSASRRVLLYNPYATTGFAIGPQPLQACDSLVASIQITPPPYTRFIVGFGDNAFDSSQNETLTHTYRNPNSYGPRLTLIDSTGCIVGIGGPSVNILGATPFFSVNNKAFCDSATVSFSDFSFSNDGIISETYTFGDGTDTIQNPGTGSFTVSHFYNTPQNYIATLQVTTDHCSETYTDTIRDYQTPHPTITVPDQLCDGFIVFQGGITAVQVDTVAWQWNFSDGQTSQFQDPNVKLAPGNYTVILKATVPPIGCFDTTSAKIVVNSLPSITGPKTITTPIGIPVTLPFSYSSNVVSYNWTPPTNLDCPTCPDPAATLIFNATYNITVTDNHGCTASDTVLVNTICNDKNYFLPNTFSPNGDGTNDYFYPRGSSIYNIQSLTIFNRWGQMVFQRRNFPANASNMGWDGTFNGHPAPADAYVYIVEVICENGQVVALHGNVTLIR